MPTFGLGGEAEVILASLAIKIDIIQLFLKRMVESGIL
jgi:hypothetical protein